MPSAPVLVYDGDCGLCSRLAEVTTRRVRQRPDDFAVVAAQQADLAGLGLTEAQCAEALQWAGASGAVSSGIDAVIAVLEHGAFWHRRLAAVLGTPGVHAVAAAAYRWVARNRHRLPGSSPSCRAV